MPSDDPQIYGSVVSANARISALQARSDAATRVAGDLDVAEGALASAGDIMAKAHELALQMANGTMDATARTNTAIEVDSLRSQLISIANTRGAMGFLFGGTQTGSPPFDVNGVFQGNANSTSVTVADGLTMTANASGSMAFTVAGGSDIFADLANFATALRNNDSSGIQQAVGQLDDGNRQLVAARVQVGATTEQIHSAIDVIGNALTAIQTSRANIASPDMPELLSNLEAAKTAYEQGIAVTREVLSVSATQRQ